MIPLKPTDFEPRRPARVQPLMPPMKSGCTGTGIAATVLICALIYGSLLLS